MSDRRALGGRGKSQAGVSGGVDVKTTDRQRQARWSLLPKKKKKKAKQQTLPLTQWMSALLSVSHIHQQVKQT